MYSKKYSLSSSDRMIPILGYIPATYIIRVDISLFFYTVANYFSDSIKKFQI